jgi:hypothetical protein
MMRLFKVRKSKYLFLLAVIILAASLKCPVSVWGDDGSGMSMEIYADQEHQNLQYNLGESVKLIMVIKNISDWSINTERGFSEINLEKSIVITDPAGVKHSVSQDKKAFDMPPPFFWNDRPASPAETLPKGWVRSATIDLDVLLPMMRTTPGWYTVEINLLFVRYFLTVYDDQIGLLGIEDDPKNWNDALSVNKLQLFIVPPKGAQAKVQVIDSSADPPAMLFQVPVKIFRTETVAANNNDLALVWNEVPVLEGTTNNEGFAVWQSDEPCLTEGNYTVIAKYSENYKDSAITSSDTGWVDASCSGVIEKEIAYGEEEPQPVPGDLDGDGDVDMNDLNNIMAARNTPATGPDDPRDLDGDGMITGLDARKLVLMCTRPRCATE